MYCGRAVAKAPVTFARHLLSPRRRWQYKRTGLCQQLHYHRTVCYRSVTSSAVDTVNMEITKANFKESLPVIQQALHDCQFFAFDCEMTGLNTQDSRQDYLDDIDDRYAQYAMGGSQFALTQFGLSAFVWSQSERQYRPRTFNFYVFPTASNGFDRRFLCQAGSLEFLAGQGFDFNKWIYQGVSSRPAEWRNRQLATLDKPRDSRQIVLRQPADIQFAQALKQQVSEWLQGDQDVLLLDATNAYRRAIQYQQLEKLTSGQQWRGFYVQRISGEVGAQLQLVRADQQQAERHEQEERQMRQDAIHDAAGFTTVFEMMRDCRKPAVGHNLSFDLTFSLAAFAQQLPQGWAAFKHLVQQWLPGGVWDTKLLARQLQGVFTEGTSLGDVYAGLAGGRLQNAVQEWLADQTSEPSHWSLPGIKHAEGYEAYQGPEAQSHAHEAGYDAFMTGAAFACLVRLYEASASQPEHSVAMQHQQPNLAAVQHLMGRLNIGRSDIPYAALWGEDPIPDRSHVLLATWLKPDTRFKPLAEQLSTKLGVRVRVTPLWNLGTQSASTALLELPSEEPVESITVTMALRSLEQPHTQLLSWKAYAAAKRAGTLHSLLDSMQPEEVANASSLKRKQRNHEATAEGQDTAEPVNDEHLNPVKKLKASISNCKMM